MKLARRPATADELAENAGDKIKVLIETRGEGGYTILAPSNGRVHPRGGAWRLEAGGFATIATIDRDERDALFALARTFDRMPAAPPRPPRSGSPDDERASDRWSRRPDIQEIVLRLLEDHGWTLVFTGREGIQLLRRPGKSHGWSATLGYAGPGVLHVFSSSVEGFDPERSYSPFAVYAILEHGGDWSAAGRALYEAEGPHGPHARFDRDDPHDDENPAGGTDDEANAGDGLAPASTLREPTGLNDELIADLVRPRTLTLVASSEGLGKSRLRHMLSISAATGDPFLGLFKVPRPLDVLALDLENGPEEEWRQEEAVLAALGMKRHELGRLVRGTVDVHLTEPEGLSRLRRILEIHRAPLVMLDTGTAAVDEEFGRELKIAIRNLVALIREFGCAFVVFVHVTKPERTGRRRAPERGLFDVMGNWPRRAAGVIVLSDLGDDRMLFQTFKRIPRRRLVLHRDNGLWAVTADLGDRGSGGTAAASGPKRTTRDRILEAIAGGLATSVDIADYIGCAPKTVINQVTKLKADGKVRGVDGSWEVIDED
jgi:hypothetical protein